MHQTLQVRADRNGWGQRHLTCAGATATWSRPKAASPSLQLHTRVDLVVDIVIVVTRRRCAQRRVQAPLVGVHTVQIARLHQLHNPHMRHRDRLQHHVIHLQAG